MIIIINFPKHKTKFFVSSLFYDEHWLHFHLDWHQLIFFFHLPIFLFINKNSKKKKKTEENVHKTWTNGTNFQCVLTESYNANVYGSNEAINNNCNGLYFNVGIKCRAIEIPWMSYWIMFNIRRYLHRRYQQILPMKW